MTSFVQNLAARNAGKSPWQRRRSMLMDSAFIVVCSVFFFVHARHLLNGTFSSVPFAVEQALLVYLFISRREATATSMRPFDWAVATIGGWGSLFLYVHDGAPAMAQGLGFGIQLCGLTLAIIGFAYLGRSFGVVAAHRGLQVNGPYRLVRHPIYFAHTITMVGFLTANFHIVNVVMFGFIMAAQVMRIRAEERVLGEESDYQAYSQQVRWRVVPGLY